MTLDYDVYEMVCDMLEDETLSVEEISVRCGVSVEDVRYVYSCEYCEC